MADPKPDRDGLAALADRLRKIENRVGDLEAPSGTQRARAVEELQAQAAILAAQQAELTAQTAALAAQVAFLASQTTYAFNGAGLSGARGASGGISLDGYDGTYDCAISLTTSSTGLLLVTVAAQVGSSAATSLVGFEVLWSGGSIGVDYARAATSGLAIVTASRSAMVTAPANTAVTVRTRRGWTGGVGATDWWAYQALSVTRVGQ